MSRRIYIKPTEGAQSGTCTKSLTIENNGVLSVGDITGYDSLVTDDNHIPNKAYVDTHGGGATSGYSGYSGISGYSGPGDSGYSGYSGQGSTNLITVQQIGHSLSVGDVIRFDGSDYVKAQADSTANAEVIGIVTEVNGADDFSYLTHGGVSGLAGMTAGSVYFLSDSTAGLLTTTEPTDVGDVTKPLFLATSTTDGVFFNWRGIEIVEDPGGGGGLSFDDLKKWLY